MSSVDWKQVAYNLVESFQKIKNMYCDDMEYIDHSLCLGCGGLVTYAEYAKTEDDYIGGSCEKCDKMFCQDCAPAWLIKIHKCSKICVDCFKKSRKRPLPPLHPLEFEKKKSKK